MSPIQIERARQEIREHLDAIETNLVVLSRDMDRSERTQLVVEVNKRLSDIHDTARRVVYDVTT